jgi:glutaredoxin-like protein NrdH
MTDTLIIYGKPGCTRCDQLVKYCRRKGIPYRYIDVDQDADAKARIESLGYAEVPVGMIGDDHFQGVRLDKIRPLARQLSKAS